MQNWFKLSLLLCVFGFLKEFRPSEPFVYEFLVGHWRNFTYEEVNHDIYPVGSYSYLGQLVIVFLITDLCRYKPLIIVLGASGVIVWAMALWTKTVWEMQIAEIFYGTLMATEVAYYTYIYAKVPKEYYPLVTSHTRAAVLTGRASSGILAQILVSLQVLDYKELNYITIPALMVATTWAVFLPKVPQSIYFHRTLENKQTRMSKYKAAFSLTKQHFLTAFSNRYVLKWSIWWMLATAGFIQIQFYIQAFWTTIKEDSDNIYNGAAEALLTVLGAIAAFCAGYLKIDWRSRGELLIFCGSIIAGVIILISSQINEIFLAYAAYITFGTIYHFMVTIASAEIAKCIMDDSYGLVIGFNMLIAVTIQTFLTLCLVSGEICTAQSPQDQYLIYGSYHIVIAVLFLLFGILSKIPCNKTIKT